jgi:hypothetical protein
MRKLFVLLLAVAALAAAGVAAGGSSKTVTISKNRLHADGRLYHDR